MLKTLFEHNIRIIEAHKSLCEPSPNGIACPDCGQELVDSNPGVVLTSLPPQMRIHCQGCDFKGTRYC